MDAPSVGISAVLSQKNHPLAFFSKPFPPKLLRASTYVRKLLAITAAVKKWRQYLLGHRFTIITDYRILRELMTQVIQTPEQQMYSAKLMGYDYSIQYRSGKLNITVDALSQLLETMDGSLLLLSILSMTFLSESKTHLLHHLDFLKLRQEITLHPDQFPNYQIAQDSILYQGRIWLPAGSSFIPTLLIKYHSSPIGGHMGLTKTLARINDDFFWPGMRKDVASFVA